MDREEVMHHLKEVRSIIGDIKSSTLAIENLLDVARQLKNSNSINIEKLYDVAIHIQYHGDLSKINIEKLEEFEKCIDNFEDFVDKIMPDDVPYDLEDLNLSTRAYNALTGAGIKTVPELLEIPEMQFVQFMDANGHKIRNMGNVVLAEVLSTLKEFNLSFKN